MPTIGLRVDEETWRKWKELNLLGNVGTEKLKDALKKILKQYEWWFEKKELIIEGRVEKEEIDTVSVEEVLAEI